MIRSGKKSGLAGVTALLALSLQAAAAAEKPHFGAIYDCSYTLRKTVDEPDLVLRRGGRYDTAPRHRGKKLAGHVETGRYRYRHGLITFRSGPLKPPPGVPVSYYDKPFNRLQVFQLRPAAVPWDCVRPGQPDLTTG